ncbi:transcriptional regulator, Fur family [[Bacteroides] pectinophilus ATCC 43243]|uniref:Transcriptional repressor n=1 Tax=[Bacteroides] pectinophilus ATCC 43243 TaxID=483218 RepID=B7AP98_9FIRM|nr:transcriptional regulator, Fur family [[Bacteroides] pectinophilus ATCC 43243]
MAAIKHSRQRDAILTFLISRKDHPTAEVVYENVRREFPKISLGTVYRNLTLLVDMGHAVKVPCDDGSVHFDGNVSPHYHFECTRCGAIIDLMNIDAGKLMAIDEMVQDGFGGKIQGHKLFFSGVCPACNKKENKSKISVDNNDKKMIN